MRRKDYEAQIETYQATIDKLEVQLKAAHRENERLMEEVDALEKGRDDQDENWQQLLADAADKLAIANTQIRFRDEEIAELKAVVEEHDKSCLPSL